MSTESIEDSRQCEDKVIIWVFWLQHRCESDRFVFADDIVQLRSSIVKTSLSKLVVIYNIEEFLKWSGNNAIDENTTWRDWVGRIIVLSIGDVGSLADVDNADVLQARFEITVGWSRRVTVTVAITISVKSQEAGLGEIV